MINYIYSNHTGGNMNKFFKIAFMLVLCASPCVLKAGEAEKQAAKELIEIFDVKKSIDQGIDIGLKIAMRSDPRIGPQEINFAKKLANKFVDVDGTKNDMINIYSELFTVKELNDMKEFYKTPTGQKEIEKTPEVLARMLEISISRMQKIAPEINKMFMEEYAQEKKQGAEDLLNKMK